MVLGIKFRGFLGRGWDLTAYKLVITFSLNHRFIKITTIETEYGARGGIVVRALHYKPAGRGFDSRWCH